MSSSQMALQDDEFVFLFVSSSSSFFHLNFRHARFKRELVVLPFGNL